MKCDMDDHFEKTLLTGLRIEAILGSRGDVSLASRNYHLKIMPSGSYPDLGILFGLKKLS